MELRKKYYDLTITDGYNASEAAALTAVPYLITALMGSGILLLAHLLRRKGKNG